MIPYWLIITIFNFHSMELSDFVRQFFFVGKYHWFVTFIIGAYAVFFLTQRFIKNRCLNNLVYIVVSITVVLLADNIKAEQGFSFYVGILISRHYEFFLKNRKALIVSSLIIGLSFFALKQIPIIRSHDGDVLYGIIQLLIKLPLALATLLFLPQMWNWSLSLIGKISWEVYLVHCSLLGYFYIDKNITVIEQLTFYTIVLLSSYIFYQFNSRILNKLRYV